MNPIQNIILIVHGLLNSVVWLLVTLGVVYFVWGVIQYVINDSEEAKKKGKNKIIFGIIGMVVIVGLWGLVDIIVYTFGIGGGLSDAQIYNINNLTPPVPVDACRVITTSSKLPDVMNYVTCVIGKSVIPLLFAVAMVMFTWGAIKFFIIDSAEEAKRSQGKQFMIWGIIALTVMICVWGLVNILGNTFGISTPFLPGVKP